MTSASEDALAALTCEISARLKFLRTAAGLSQADLAHAAGMSRNHYQILESGHGRGRGQDILANPRLSSLLALAGALGVEVVDLLPPPVGADRSRPVSSG